MVQVPLPGQVATQPPAVGGLGAQRIAAPIDTAPAQQLQRQGDAVHRQAMGVLVEHVNDMRERRRVAALKEAQARAEEKIQNADREFKATLGQEAGATQKDRWDTLAKDVESVEKTLEFEDEREVFRQYAQRRMVGVSSGWSIHSDEQLRLHEIGVGESLIIRKSEWAREQGYRNKVNPVPEGWPQVPEADALESLKFEAESVAIKKGLPPEAVELFVRQKTTQVHVDVLNDLLREDEVGLAREYLDSVQGKDEIDAATMAKIDETMRTASLAERAARDVLDIEDMVRRKHHDAQTAVEGQGPPPRPQPMFAAEFRDEAREEVLRRFADEEIDVRQREMMLGEIDRMAGIYSDRESSERAELIDRGRRYLLSDTRHSTATLQRDDAGLYQDLDDRGLIVDLNRFDAQSGNFASDQQVLLDLASGRILRTPLPEFERLIVDKLSPADQRYAMGLYAKANKLDDDRFVELISDTELILEGARLAEIVPREGGKESVRARGSRRFFLWNEHIQSLWARENATKGLAGYRRRKEIMEEAAKDWAMTEAGEQVPAGALTDDELSGMTEEERQEAILSGEPIPKRGATVDGESMSAWWRRNVPNRDVPLLVRNSGPVPLSDVPSSFQMEAAELIRRNGKTPGRNGIMAYWLTRTPTERKEIRRQEDENRRRAAEILNAGVDRAPDVTAMREAMESQEPVNPFFGGASTFGRRQGGGISTMMAPRGGTR